MTWRATMLGFAILVAACGVKNRPLPPETVQPEPPETLGAIASPDGVRVSWVRPTHYQGGKRMNDLGGFTVERATGEGEPFKAVGKVEVDDQNRFRKDRSMEWLDHDVTPGARYLYRVTSFTLDGYRSAPAGPVAVRFGPAQKEPAP